jgi:hypothetical protein
VVGGTEVDDGGTVDVPSVVVGRVEVDDDVDVFGSVVLVVPGRVVVVEPGGALVVVVVVPSVVLVVVSKGWVVVVNGMAVVVVVVLDGVPPVVVVVSDGPPVVVVSHENRQSASAHVIEDRARMNRARAVAMRMRRIMSHSFSGRRSGKP